MPLRPPTPITLRAPTPPAKPPPQGGSVSGRARRLVAPAEATCYFHVFRQRLICGRGPPPARRRTEVTCALAGRYVDASKRRDRYEPRRWPTSPSPRKLWLLYSAVAVHRCRPIAGKTSHDASDGVGGDDSGSSDQGGETTGAHQSAQKGGVARGVAQRTRLKQGLCVLGGLFAVAALLYLPKAFSIATSYSSYLDLATPTFLAVVQYKAQQVLVSSFEMKLLAIVALAAPLIILGGLMYATIKRADVGESMFLAYAVVNNCPGTDVVSEQDVWPKFVLNIIFVVGMLTYAVFLGFVSDEVRTEIDLVRDSNAPVMESGHNVVLGWNRIGTSLLRQAAISRDELPHSTWGKPIVILCEEGTPEFRDALHDQLEGLNINVIVRQGNPCFIPDLLRAGTTRANTVVMLDTSLGSEEADQSIEDLNRMATASGLNLAVSQVPGQMTHGQTLVMQTDHPVDRSWLLLLGKSEFESSHPDNRLVDCYNMERVGQLAVQCALQPGLGKVYTALLQQSRDSAEFYVVSKPEMVGKTHHQIRRAFPSAIVVGYLSSEPGVTDALMNPADDYVMGSSDDIVFIASNGAVRKRGTETEEASPISLDVSHAPAASPTDVVILSQSDEMCESELEKLAELAQPGSSVVVIAEEEPPDLMRYNSQTLSVRFVKGSVTEREVLMSAGVATCDSVVLGQSSPHETGHKRQEINTFASLMAVSSFRLQSAAAGVSAAGSSLTPSGCAPSGSKPLHIVGLASCSETVQAANIIADRSKGAITVDMLEPDQMVGGVLAQVAAEPQLSKVLRQLTVNEGSEIYVRRLEQYFPKGTEPSGVAFRELETRARMQGETAIGFIEHGETERVRLAIPRDTVVGSDDRLVVIY